MTVLILADVYSARVIVQLRDANVNSIPLPTPREEVERRRGGPEESCV